MKLPDKKRVDTASSVIETTADVIYQAFADPDAWMQWLPPTGMTCDIAEFSFREGGRYRLTLTYAEQSATERAATIPTSCKGSLPSWLRIREWCTSDDDAFAGAMRMTWELSPENSGTHVAVTAEDVPPGIPPEDHAMGLRSTLENLARYLTS